MGHTSHSISPERVLLYGGTGQAKVIRSIVEQNGARVVAIFDDTENLQPPFEDIPLYRGMAELETWLQGQDPPSIGFCVTIGNPHGRARLRIHERLKAFGLIPITPVHPSAWIEQNAIVGEGCQIHAGAIIGAETTLGRCCIVNTKASADHECNLHDGSELAPGATLCGLVTVETAAWVCAGATVLPRITIGSDAIVGAGALVRRDVQPGVTVAGIPAQILQIKSGRGK